MKEGPRSPFRHVRGGFVLALATIATGAVLADEVDTFNLTDEPGNWFKSENTGTPVTIINRNQRVDFKINDCCTNTRHTVTLLSKPVNSTVTMDQDSSQMGSLSVTFDRAGVYVFVCKVHPYMTAVVAVRDANGNIPPVTAAQLPFIGHLGVNSLPAETVLSVMTTVAPTDADKVAKWDILGPEAQQIPSVPGVGEVWINTQFERVPGQVDNNGTEKPGTITVLDAATFAIEREINGLTADGMWNNPHNMWADFGLDTVYNSNWFGKWINKIDRETGAILDSTAVGEAPTHIITIPTETSNQLGWLTIPLSADDDLVKVRDGSGGLDVVDGDHTGVGKTHPHGHWLTCGTGERVIVPNVFKGIGFAGSISIMDTISGNVIREFNHDANDPLRSALLMPIAAGECHVDGVSTAYVANLVSGFVTVINVDTAELITNIPVTTTPDGQLGQNILHTLQGPIQTPVSPDEKWVATAVISLTNVPHQPTNSPDHVALIDTSTNQVVKFIATPAGTHGVNWGAKLGGGYYAYVTNQHANVLTIIDPDPNGDGNGADGAVVGTILLDNNSTGAGATDGTGGQGIKPLPMTHDGWIQKTVTLAQEGATSEEVADWIDLLTPDQRDPSHHGEVTLTNASVVTGRRLAGGLAQLLESDNETMRIEAVQFANAQQLELRVRGTADDVDAVHLNFLVESRLSTPGGSLILRLRNWETGGFETIGQFNIGTAETEFMLNNIDAAGHVRASDGLVELRLRERVVVSFGTLFRGFFDHVQIETGE
jgi:YVTN family beta-propeller protein